MTRLAPPEALRRAGGYAHAVLSFVGDDGYPVAVGSTFAVTDNAVELGPLGVLPGNGTDVCVTFSHIRPQRGVGYDQRRYVNVWGRAEVAGDRVRVAVDRASGWDEHDTPFFEYAERSVDRGLRYMRARGQRPRLSAWWTFFVAARLPFLTATIVPVALGGAIAARDGAFSWSRFGLVLLAGCCVHLGLNIANDLFDDASGADAANLTPTPFSGGSRVIQHGLVSRRAMAVMCAAFYTAGLSIGLWLAAHGRPWLLVIGAAGVFLSLAYTGPPLRLVHRGLGEPVTALGFGPVMTLGAYYVLAGRFSGLAVFASLPVALLIAMVLYVNEVPDRAGDAAAGKRTLIVRWPKQRVVRGFALSVGVAYGLIVAGVIFRLMPVFALAALLTVPMARRVRASLAKYYDRPYDLMPAMQTNIALHLFTGLLLIAAYVVDLVV